MARSLKLTVSESSSYVGVSSVPGYRIQLTATEAINIEPEVFVVEAAPTEDDLDRVAYLLVATASDMSNLSQGSPPVGSPDLPYRVSELEVLTDSLVSAEEFVLDVRRRLADLIRSLDELDTFSTSREYVIASE